MGEQESCCPVNRTHYCKCDDILEQDATTSTIKSFVQSAFAIKCKTCTSLKEKWLQLDHLAGLDYLVYMESKY